jgi:nucleoside diphosphate kinase
MSTIDAAISSTRISYSFLAGAAVAIVAAGLAWRSFNKDGAQQGDSGTLNRALVFLKPHASTNPAIATLVLDKLTARGIRVVDDGSVDGARIAEERLIDRHYAAIAAYAVGDVDPSTASIPAAGQAAFKERFGHTWESAASSKLVMSAVEAAKHFGVELLEVSELWEADPARGLKLMPGFAVKRLQKGAGAAVYVVNGFYVANRAKYVDPKATVRWFVVEWPERELTWESFRRDVIGATDPQQATKGSIRRSIAERWIALGLDEAPNMGQNAVHASAGPLEGVVERCIWTGATLDTDPVAKAWLATGEIARADLTRATTNPLVAQANGRLVPLFDVVEDMDTSAATVALPLLLRRDA